MKGNTHKAGNNVRCKIGLILPYFGKFPFWMPAFYLSCKYNPTIDWFIFSDNKKPDNLPENIIYTHLELDELNKYIDKELKLEIKIKKEYAYKLCDIKPAYGLIFKEYIKEYNYWGHCDMDIIWGDIEKILLRENFYNFDIFTSRINKIAGHFCIYKNCNKVNNLFRGIKKFSQFANHTDRYCGVDEKYLSRLIKKKINKNYWIKKLKFPLIKYIYAPTIYWNKILATPGWYQRQLHSDESIGFLWKNGSVYHIDGEELMYIHFHKLKSGMKGIDFDYKDAPDQFLIKSDGIYRME